MSKKFFYKLSNHTASGHQLESCTQKKGFAPYIHIYKFIYMYIISKTQVQVGHTYFKSVLHCMVWRDFENHQESTMISLRNHVFPNHSQNCLKRLLNSFVTDQLMYERTDGQMDRRTDGRTNRLTDLPTEKWHATKN